MHIRRPSPPSTVASRRKHFTNRGAEDLDERQLPGRHLTRSALGMCFAGLMTSCAISAEEAADGFIDEPADSTVGTKEQGLEIDGDSGEVLPSYLNAGVVHLRVAGPSGRMEDCTGQIVSRDSILTAAHCFADVGYYDDGWHREVDALVFVKHQNPDGSWEYLSGYSVVKVFVQEKYVTQRIQDGDDLGITKRHGLDVAVVQRSTNWNGVQQSDTSAIAKYSDQQPGRLHVYGHGNFADNERGHGAGTDVINDDDTLRRTSYDGMTWIRDSDDNRYRTIEVEYEFESDEGHICKGDSGGPWKLDAFNDDGFTTVQFGVTSVGQPTGNFGYECGETRGYAAIVALNDGWIKNRIQEGRGSCSSKQFAVLYAPEQRSLLRYYPSSMFEKWVDAYVCW